MAARSPWLWWVLGGLGAAVIIWFGIGLGLRWAYAGRVLPGVHVAGIDVGGLSPTAVRDRLAASERTVTLIYNGKRFSVRASEVGYHLNLDATVENVRGAGRSGPLAGLVKDPLFLWTDHIANVVAAVDRDRLDAAIDSVAERVNREPFVGALSINPDTLRVRAVPPRPGTRVARRAAAQQVLAELGRPGARAVPLPVRGTGRVPPEQVRAIAREARTYLEKSLRLQGQESSVEIAPGQLANVLAVERGEESGKPYVQLGVDNEKLSALVDTLAADIDQEASNAEITAPARPLTVDEKSDLSWQPRSAEVEVKPGATGRRLGQSAAAQAIAAAVRSGGHTARLPVRTTDPELTTQEAGEVTSLIGTFTTHFACCEPRVTNIQRMAEVIDGTIVLPGQQFSLNEAAGERTRAKGYVPAPFILRGKLVPDVGGGVSQFSTTAYNAAYFAGLEMNDHQAHSYYISRYPPGRESTLNYPTIDLVWTNNTDAPVLVRATTTDTSVTVTLYGDNGGRTVEAVTEDRQPWPQGDFTITVARMITYPDGREIRQSHTTRYEKAPH